VIEVAGVELGDGVASRVVKVTAGTGAGTTGAVAEGAGVMASLISGGMNKGSPPPERCSGVRAISPAGGEPRA
jgi:hypothetical protein